VFRSKPPEPEVAKAEARAWARVLQQRGGDLMYSELTAGQDIGQQAYGNSKLFAWLAQKSGP